MLRRVSLILALLALPTIALAEAQYPKQDSPEARACRHDAQRFCKNEIPDQFRVASCLQSNRERISRPCRAVLESHGM
jgi:hypothetical protein